MDVEKTPFETVLISSLFPAPQLPQLLRHRLVRRRQGGHPPGHLPAISRQRHRRLGHLHLLHSNEHPPHHQDTECRPLGHWPTSQLRRRLR